MTQTSVGRFVIVVAHGAHVGNELTLRGEHQLEMLARQMSDLCSRGALPVPSVVLSSCREHAIATAERLRHRIGCPDDVVQLCELTPRCKGSIGSLARISDEYAKTSEAGLPRVVLVVGHEGRLSNLITEMTGQRLRPVFNGEAVVVRADDETDFALGKGQVFARLPVVAHAESDVRAKLQSKMTTTAVLAGFAGAALVEVGVNAPPSPGGFTFTAVSFLSLSLVLLISSLLIYDQLAMPEGFWTDGHRPGWLRSLNKYKERRLNDAWAKESQRKAACELDQRKRWELTDDSLRFADPRLNGPMFTNMVRAHRRLFIPGLFFGVIGVGSALASGGHPWLAAPLALALPIVGAWYLAHRPSLGVD